MKPLSIVLALTTLVSCTVGEDDPEDPEADIEGEQDDSPMGAEDSISAGNKGAPGVNSKWCKASDYNCRFRYDDSRITAPDGSEVWEVVPGAPVRDGNGLILLQQQVSDAMKFNFGQLKTIAQNQYALGMSTSNGSAGWYRIDHIVRQQAFRQRVGNVAARDPGLGKMACYKIRDSDPSSSLAEKKVVHDSQSTNEKLGDYLPLKRKNGKRSANLVFSVPGFGLGGATTDHFPAGTKFQRVKVTTYAGNPSITIPLWVKNGNGDYKKQSGDATFIYGYIVGNGAKRFGWMAMDALLVSSNCP